jgi:hypothetical protein
MTTVPKPAAFPEPGPVVRWVLIAVMGLFLVLPQLDQWKKEWNPHTFLVVESRHPSPRPGPITDWNSLVAWTEEWDAYMTDRLGFRKQVLVSGQWLKWKLRLPTARVIWGKNDWAFLHTFFEVNMPAYLRGTVVWDQKVVNRFVRIMERRRDWLAEQGIPMLIVVSPVKGSVYPEYLPEGIQPVAPTMRELMFKEIDRTGSDLRVVDLLPDLLAAKSKEAFPLYFSTDTHWNEIGARVAYETIIRELNPLYPNLEPIPRDALQSTPVACIGLDLGVLSSLANFMHDTRYDTIPSGDTHIQYAVVDGKREEPHPEFGFHLSHTDGTLPVRVVTDRSDRPKVLVYRDSYMNAMSYYFNETFSEVHYHHHYGMQFDPQPVLDIKPDLVIYQFLERALLQFDPEGSVQKEHASLYSSGEGLSPGVK